MNSSRVSLCLLKASYCPKLRGRLGSVAEPRTVVENQISRRRGRYNRLVNYAVREKLRYSRYYIRFSDGYSLNRYSGIDHRGNWRHSLHF
jgi:hypothetical protein